MTISNLKQRRDLDIRLRYHRNLVAVSKVPPTFGDTITCHRKLVAVSNLQATRFGDTIMLPSQFMTMRNLPATRFGDTITLPSQACGCEQHTNDEVWGHDYVAIASLWL